MAQQDRGDMSTYQFKFTVQIQGSKQQAKDFWRDELANLLRHTAERLQQKDGDHIWNMRATRLSFGLRDSTGKRCGTFELLRDTFDGED